MLLQTIGYPVEHRNIKEFTKRPNIKPSDETDAVKRYNPHHIVRASTKTLEECLALSDVVISAVPSKSYKVKTELLKSGAIYDLELRCNRLLRRASRAIPLRFGSLEFRYHLQDKGELLWRN